VTYQTVAQVPQDSDANEARPLVRLGRGRPGLRGIVMSVGGAGFSSGPDNQAFDIELEKRLLEIGFVEGAHVEILHEGFIGKDPIAVRVDNMSVALGRREADAVMVASESANPRLLPDRSN
jgi:ferrous iron transport protein A